MHCTADEGGMRLPLTANTGLGVDRHAAALHNTERPNGQTLLSSNRGAVRALILSGIRMLLRVAQVLVGVLDACPVLEDRPTARRANDGHSVSL